MAPPRGPTGIPPPRVQQAVRAARQGAWNISYETERKSGPDHEPATEKSPFAWQEVFRSLAKDDEAMSIVHKDEIDTHLVFAGLFSAVVTAFVIQSYSNLQENYSQESASALFYLSRQLSNSTLAPLPPHAAFVAEPSDIRANAFWLSSLVVSLIAAWLCIVVKSWGREYVSWKDLTPGPQTIALRQYRANAWRRWRVSWWRNAIPLLLQLALLLFFGGLLELLWHTQVFLAALITTLVGLSAALVFGASFIASWRLDCPYRTPVTWLLKYMTRAARQLAGTCKNIILALMTRSWRRGAISSCLREFRFGTNLVSWDHQDASFLDVPSVSRPYMIQALGETMVATLSSLGLDTIASPLYDSSGPVPCIPMRDLRTLLEQINGDIIAPRKDILRHLQAANPDELYSFRSLPPDFVKAVVGLTRRAAERQTIPDVQDIQAAEDVLDITGVISKANPLVSAYHVTTLVGLLSSPLRELSAKHLRWFAAEAVGLPSRATAWSDWKTRDTILLLKMITPLLGSSNMNVAGVPSKPVSFSLVRIHGARVESQPVMLRCTAPSTRWCLLDASMIALRLIKEHERALTISKGQTTINAFLLAMTAELGILELTEAPPHRCRILPPGWYLLFNQVLTLHKFDKDETLKPLSDLVSLVPACLARSVIAYLQLDTDIGPGSAVDISMEVASRLAADVARSRGLPTRTPASQQVPANLDSVVHPSNLPSTTAAANTGLATGSSATPIVTHTVGVNRAVAASDTSPPNAPSAHNSSAPGPSGDAHPRDANNNECSIGEEQLVGDGKPGQLKGKSEKAKGKEPEAR